MNRLAVDFLGNHLKNPVVMASGTYGFGTEYARFYDPAELGGFSTKGLTLEPRPGNSGIRLWETPSGLLNSIGLENPGIDDFVGRIWPEIKDLDTLILANVGGKDEESYLEAVRRLNDIDIPIIELNISCPNVKAGGMAYGMEPDKAGEITEKVKNVSRHPVMVKLSPNAGDLVGVAKACEQAGADALSLINTLQGMAIDWRTKKIVFDNTYAGFSGPAVKPVALRMVHQVCGAVDIPVMGLGGITTWQDALEFMLAGASCIQIGTAGFADPYAPLAVIDGLERYCEDEDVMLADLIGKAVK